MKAQAALPDAVRRLTSAGVPDAARDARKLLAHALRLPPDRLTLHLGDDLTPQEIARFDAALAARCMWPTAAHTRSTAPSWVTAV